MGRRPGQHHRNLERLCYSTILEWAKQDRGLEGLKVSKSTIIRIRLSPHFPLNTEVLTHGELGIFFPLDPRTKHQDGKKNETCLSGC